MHIGILQTGHAPEEIQEKSGDFDGMFRRFLSDQGFTFSTFNVVDMEFPETAKDCDAWLVTGSRHGAYENHAFIPLLEDFIRDAYSGAIPMVGVCFGHQIIAQALGGRVEKFDGGWAVGRQTYDWDGTEISLNAWHQDQVLEAPDGATCLAGNEFCKNAALLYGNRAFTVQPHPEFGADVVKGLIEYRGPGNVPAPLLDTATKALNTPVANKRLAQMVANFFRDGAPT